jgi:hypothetical protein
MAFHGEWCMADDEANEYLDRQRAADVRRESASGRATFGRGAMWLVGLAVLLVMGVFAATASAAVPTLSVSPTGGAPGQTVVATGSGFPGRTALAFTWDGAPSQSLSSRTRRNGSFSVSLTLPQLAAGKHSLGVTAGSAHASAPVQFNSVSPTPSLTPTPSLIPTASPTSTPPPAASPTSTPAPLPTATPLPTQTAAGPTLGGCAVLPADNIWNTRVDSLPVSALSASYVTSIGGGTGLHADFGTVYNGAPNGIPFVIVPGSQPRVPVSFTYADESDLGPYPIPPSAPIEGGPSSTGDRHVLVVDSGMCKLYELYSAYPNAGGDWSAGSGAVFSLTSDALRPAGWTSADAAGLPILPGLVRYDEVAAGQISHALRFTAAVTQKAYVWPARHFASSNINTTLPPMGARVRLKAGVDISHFSPANQVILRALKTYGMLLADNGSNWFVSGAPDSRWNDSDLAALRQIVGSNLEVVDTSSLMVDPNSGQARTP